MTDVLWCQDFFGKYIRVNLRKLLVLEISSLIRKCHHSEFKEEIVLSQYFETKSYQDETETNFTRGENPKLWWQMAVKFKHFNFHILRQFIFIKVGPCPANLFKQRCQELMKINNFSFIIKELLLWSTTKKLQWLEKKTWGTIGFLRCFWSQVFIKGTSALYSI